MRILVDLDDVLELLSVRWVEAIEERYGIHKTREEMVNWDVCKTYPTLNAEQVYGLLSEPEFWDGIKPMPGAAEVLKEFQDRGHEVFVVTSSYYKGLAAKLEKALFPLYPFIDWDHVIITRRKDLVQGDVLIDDNADNLAAGSFIKVLFDSPWNRGVDASAFGMIRVQNWEEIRNILTQIEKSITFERPDRIGVGVKSRKEDKCSE